MVKYIGMKNSNCRLNLVCLFNDKKVNINLFNKNEYRKRLIEKEELLIKNIQSLIIIV